MTMINKEVEKILSGLDNVEMVILNEIVLDWKTKRVDDYDTIRRITALLQSNTTGRSVLGLQSGHSYISLITPTKKKNETILIKKIKNYSFILFG